jgi:DNA-binding protein H-NS
MAIDLSTLSPKQLEKLISDANREKKRKQKRAPIAQVRKKLTRMAVAEGYSLAELFGIQNGPRERAEKPASPAKRTARKSTAGSKVAPKYRNPENPAETWSGRGQYPKWMRGPIAAGKKPEDFAI